MNNILRECKSCNQLLDPNLFLYQNGKVCTACYKRKNKELYTNKRKLKIQPFDKHKNKYVREDYWNAVIHLSGRDLYTSKCTESDIQCLLQEGYGFILKEKYNRPHEKM